MSGEETAGRGESLRWRVHALAAGEARSLRWGSRDEGLVQVLTGAAAATTIGAEAAELDSATVLWLRGGRDVELAAHRPSRCLEVRVEGATGEPAAIAMRWSGLPRQQIVGAMGGRSVAGEGVSAWLFDITAGYRVDDLEHAEEQVSAPLAGDFEMLLEGLATPLTPGAVAYVPPWLRHGGDFARSAATLLEVFSPPRRGELTLAL